MSPEPQTEIYSYALLRAVPSLERGELLNIGIALHCRRQQFLDVYFNVDENRLQSAFPNLDLAAVCTHTEMIKRVAAGEHSAGAVAQMDRSDRFGWITAPSNTLIQPGPIHTGLCGDAATMLKRLAARLVDHD